jgi:hypothetical protein
MIYIGHKFPDATSKLASQSAKAAAKKLGSDCHARELN